MRSGDGSVSFDGTTTNRSTFCSVSRENRKTHIGTRTDMENNMLCLLFCKAFSSIASRLRFLTDAQHCLCSACWKPKQRLSSVISCNYENYANSFLWQVDRMSCETAEWCVKLFITCLMRHNSIAMCNRRPLSSDRRCSKKKGTFQVAVVVMKTLEIPLCHNRFEWS